MSLGDCTTNYVAVFADGFDCITRHDWAGVYLQGPLLDGERKSIHPLVQRVSVPGWHGDTKQALQRLGADAQAGRCKNESRGPKTASAVNGPSPTRANLQRGCVFGGASWVAGSLEPGIDSVIVTGEPLFYLARHAWRRVGREKSLPS